MKKLRPAAPPVLLAALAAALSAAFMAGLTACGTSGSSTTARNGPAGTPATSAADPLADLTATAIMTKAFADIAAASSVHFTATGTGSGPQFSSAFTVVRGRGCTGSISFSTTGSFQLINDPGG